MLDESFRTSTRYKALPEQGLRCTALQGNLANGSDWIARFTFMGIDKEKAKVLAMAWLSHEFDGKSFTFYRKADEASYVFYCKFYRGDV